MLTVIESFSSTDVAVAAIVPSLFALFLLLILIPVNIVLEQFCATSQSFVACSDFIVIMMTSYCVISCHVY